MDPGFAAAREFEGRVALVTGGAGDGIGSATVRRLAAAGASVAIVDEHARRTAEFSMRIAEETSGRVVGLPGDVADRARMDEVVAEVTSALGPIDVLVNNAAINALEEVAKLEPADWDRVMAVDLDACFYLIRATLPGMIERGRGAIVNVSSVAGYIGNPREAAYAAAKAALHSLTRTVAAEAGPHGVRCNGVATGIIWSKFVRKFEASMRPEALRTPLRRFGEPEEVAELVAFLASERSAFITGETINISGGWYMRP